MIPYPLVYIPRAVLDGLFLYVAYTALSNNQLFERIMLLFTEQVGVKLHSLNPRTEQTASSALILTNSFSPRTEQTASSALILTNSFSPRTEQTASSALILTETNSFNPRTEQTANRFQKAFSRPGK
jgi:hypothetical protein